MEIRGHGASRLNGEVGLSRNSDRPDDRWIQSEYLRLSEINMICRHWRMGEEECRGSMHSTHRNMCAMEDNERSLSVS